MSEGVMEQETEGKVPHLMVTATWKLTPASKEEQQDSSEAGALSSESAKVGIQEPALPATST